MPVDERVHGQAGRRAVTVAFSAQGLSFAALVTRIPALQARFGLSDAALAALLAVVPVIAGAGSVTAGALAGRLTSRRVLRVAGPCVPLAVLAVGLSPTLPVLFVALALVGTALGAVDALVNMQGVAVQAVYRRPVMASFYAFFSLAGIVGALLAAGSAAIGLSLAASFALLCAVVIPIQVVTGRDLPRLDVQQQRDAERSGALPWRGILLIGTALACVYLLDSSVSNWSAVYLTRVLHSTQSVAALAYGGYACMTALTRAGVDRVSGRVGPVSVVRGGAVVALLGLTVVTLAPSAALALAGFALLGIGIAAAIPLAFSAAAALSPAQSGRIVAWVNVFNYVGVILGAPLVGLIGDSSSLRWGVAALLPVAIVVLVLAPAFQPRRTPAAQTT